MKQIIIFLLVIILLLIGYSQYKQYKRFTPPEYKYTSSKNIDLNYHDRSFLLDYYQSIETLNGYVILQWSTNEIDVRNPGDNDEKTEAAATEYAKKLVTVKFFEDQLIKSAELKKAGLNNADIRMLEQKGISLKDYTKVKDEKKHIDLFKKLYNDEVQRNNIRLGSRNAFIFEMQKLLVKKGYDIPVDGVFKTATFEALRAFEEKNNLFADGRLDALTLEHLLKQ